MDLKAIYVCPVRGLAGLEAPDPQRLGKAAAIAADMHLRGLLLPVLEEALLQAPKLKVLYLDGLAAALDRIEDAGLEAGLLAPAGNVLTLRWVAPYLASGHQDARAEPVFLDRKLRRVRAYGWWAEPPLIEKRVRVFKELVSALGGHPALKEWILLDRELEWSRPSQQGADLVLRSCIGEIKERGDGTGIHLGVGWRELLEPALVQGLAGRVDGLRLGGMDAPPSDAAVRGKFAGEARWAAFAATMAQWLFNRPVMIDIGYQAAENSSGLEEAADAGRMIATEPLTGIVWATLVDPEPALRMNPPWNLSSGLDQIGLLSPGLEPKGWVPAWLSALQTASVLKDPFDFIDMAPEDYRADAGQHLRRLWGRFRESRA